MKCCVYTRAFLERAYLTSFIEHYVSLGFDKIIILKADTTLYTCPDEFKSFVEIHNVPNKGNDLIPVYIDKVKKSTYDWILSVDVDEFLLLNKKYKDIKDFVSLQLSKNANINGFFFRWGAIEKYDVDQGLCFQDLLLKYKIFKNIHIKSMIKRTFLSTQINPHYFKFSNKPVIYFENKIYDTPSPLHNLTKQSYDDSILVHVHTRSVHNIVTKSCKTALTSKIIRSADKFKALVHENSLNNCFDKFKQVIGLKATLPFIHAKPIKSDAVIDLQNYTFPQHKSTFTTEAMEWSDIKDLMKEKGIDLEKYKLLVREISRLAKPTFLK